MIIVMTAFWNHPASTIRRAPSRNAPTDIHSPIFTPDTADLPSEKIPANPNVSSGPRRWAATRSTAGI
ncbi:hypothetical protein GCM10009799_44090 [Nocardiopsis rhodophaea]|uniref:Uncharacterized protein n=1 Tax=Nocardiopsis rhodophaea TaxID=280238 RepID=A0ABN2TIR9_9ACTN